MGLWAKMMKMKFNGCSFQLHLHWSLKRIYIRIFEGWRFNWGAKRRYDFVTNWWGLLENSKLVQVIEEINSYDMILENCKNQLATFLRDHEFKRHKHISSTSSAKYDLYWKTHCTVLQNRFDSTPWTEIYLSYFSKIYILIQRALILVEKLFAARNDQ